MTRPREAFGRAERNGRWARGASAWAWVAVVALGGCYRTNERTDTSETDAAVNGVVDSYVVPVDAFVESADGAVVVTDCQRDADCATGSYCVLDVAEPPVDLARVPLVCGAAVGGALPGTECATNGACQNGLCALAGGCVEPCLTADDCQAGERCTAVPIVTSATTMQTALACVHWSDAPTGVDVLAPTSLATTPFDENELTLPASMADTTLYELVAPTADDSRTALELTTASGRSLFSIGRWGITPQTNPVAAFHDCVPVLVPNANTAAPHEDLLLSLQTGAERALTSIQASASTEGSVVDMNLFYASTDQPVGGVPPSSVQALLTYYGEVLSTLSIRVGRVRNFAIVGSRADTYAFVDDDAEVGEILALSAGAARPALNVFFVRSSSDFLGIAGGIPGPAVTHGTRSSGIILTLDDLQDLIGRYLPENGGGVTLAHETGHFSGLFHVTEADGSVLEPLDDTPTCPASFDADRDGYVSAAECASRGGDNVMFWGVVTGAPVISARQSSVYRHALFLGR